MSERRQQAWDEAQRRYPPGDRQAGFVSGAAWADDNPQPHIITRAALRDTAMMIEHTQQDEIEAMLPGLLGIEVADDD